eukprot:gene39071-48260_t
MEAPSALLGQLWGDDPGFNWTMGYRYDSDVYFPYLTQVAQGGRKFAKALKRELFYGAAGDVGRRSQAALAVRVHCRHYFSEKLWRPLSMGMPGLTRAEACRVLIRVAAAAARSLRGHAADGAADGAAPRYVASARLDGWGGQRRGRWATAPAAWGDDGDGGGDDGCAGFLNVDVGMALPGDVQSGAVGDDGDSDGDGHAAARRVLYAPRATQEEVARGAGSR